jgi:hypothetical protein
MYILFNVMHAGAGGGNHGGGYPASFLRTLNLELCLRCYSSSSDSTPGVQKTPRTPLMIKCPRPSENRDHLICKDRLGTGARKLRDERWRVSAGGLQRAAELAARTTQFNTAAPQPQEQALAMLEQLVASGGEVRTARAARAINHSRDIVM